MYLRITERRNRDGSTVAYYALAENALAGAADLTGAVTMDDNTVVLPVP